MMDTAFVQDAAGQAGGKAEKSKTHLPLKLLDFVSAVERTCDL